MSETAFTLESAIKELLPRQVRLVIYLVVGVALLGFAAWQAAEGNWSAFIVSILGTLSSVLASANINPSTMKTNIVTVEGPAGPMGAPGTIDTEEVKALVQATVYSLLSDQAESTAALNEAAAWAAATATEETSEAETDG